MAGKPDSKPRKFSFVLALVIFQLLFIVLFGIFVRYDDAALPSDGTHVKKNVTGENHTGNKSVEYSPAEKEEATAEDTVELAAYYPMFQDVHVMIFIGFGFLMTFLRRYGYSSIAFNMLIAAFVIEWAILCRGFFEMTSEDLQIKLEITKLLTADFACAAVLITFGALLGKTSPLQMIVIAFIEIIFYSVNEYIGVSLLKVVDVGGSMFVHTFGAYFGLAVARVLYDKRVTESPSNGSVYHSDLFSMIGTVFLWIYWPSFNAALAPGDAQHRAVINTYLALAACCVVAFTISALVDDKGKLDMVHVQNATLAGGVAVGTSADLLIHPVGALIIGSLAAVLSTCGFKYITPFLEDKLRIHDTCGVNNLHGMPGILAGIIGAVVAAIASTDQYGDSFFPVAERSSAAQGGFQTLALLITIVIAIVSGVITGFIVKLFGLPPPYYDDTIWWNTPDDLAPPLVDSERPPDDSAQPLKDLA